MREKFLFAIGGVIKLISAIAVNKLPRFNNVNVNFIVWAPDFFTLRYLFNDNLIRVLSTYHELKKQGKTVTIYTKHDIGKFRNKRIFVFPDANINHYSLIDYSKQLQLIAEQLTLQDNELFPNAREIKFWENKLFMHEIFENQKIRTPETKIQLTKNINNLVHNRFPLLLKEPNSCSSAGVYNIKSIEHLNTILKIKNIATRNHSLIFQERLEIRKDLRVIFVGEKIIWHYWRLNNSDSWKPTSTGKGGGVDFQNFPEKWREWIIVNIRKLKMSNGAFDIAWEYDDLESEPYILEVSPFYQPNPLCKSKINLLNYGEWKKSIKIKENYQLKFVQLTSQIQKQIVMYHLFSKNG